MNSVILKNVRMNLNGIEIFAEEACVSPNEMSGKVVVSIPPRDGLAGDGGEERPVRKKKTKKPRKRPRTDLMHRQFGTGKEDIMDIRKFFAKWKKGELLTPNELARVDKQYGLFYPSMSQEKKTEILNLFLEIRDRMLIKKNPFDGDPESAQAGQE